MKTMISSRGLCSARPAWNIRRFLTSSGWSRRCSTSNLPPASADGRVAHCRQHRHVSLPSSLNWHKRSLRAEGAEDESEGAEDEGEGAEEGEGVEEGEGAE